MNTPHKFTDCLAKVVQVVASFCTTNCAVMNIPRVTQAMRIKRFSKLQMELSAREAEKSSL